MFIYKHTVHDTSKPVVTAWRRVREIYYDKEREWRKPDNEISVREAVNMFHKYSRRLRESKVELNNGGDVEQ